MKHPNDYAEMPTALDLIQGEFERQATMPSTEVVTRLEEMNSLNDRIATAIAYLGRAARTHRNVVVEGCDPVENLTKAGAVICTAIAAELNRRASEASAREEAQLTELEEGDDE